MRLSPSFPGSRQVVGTVLAVILAACQPPPDAARVDARGNDAAVDDAGRGSDDDGGSKEAGQCRTPVRSDPLAAVRDQCKFKTGAKVTETLPITENERAAIPIKHVIVLMKENRSFDHILGNLSRFGQPDAEPIPASFTNQDKNGVSVAPYHIGSTCFPADAGHQWADMHRQVNGGKMDQFVLNGADTTGTDGHFVMGNFEPSDIPFYYWLANTFAINDRHFPSARSGTWPNRGFLLMGTADGVTCTYCGLPNPATPTIMTRLDDAGVAWGVYSDGEPFDGTLGWERPHAGLYSFAEFQAALHDGTLPAVSFVDSIDFVEDEHPSADVQLGESWTRVVYQAMVKSPLWPTMAAIWTYDEAGGLADHVPPPNAACIARPGNALDEPFFELGVRVPLAVISPYARPHYVSHVVEDHTAVTRFIEAVFNLPALTSRDANSTALLEMFDFGCAPSLLQPPEAPEAGQGGCHGNITLLTDKSIYQTADALKVTVRFSGVPAPDAADRIGIYPYPRAKEQVPSEANPIEPIAWGYVGGQGQTKAGAPASGTVVLDKTVLRAGAMWPLAEGLYIIYYLSAKAAGADGHTPAASVDIHVTP